MSGGISSRARVIGTALQPCNVSFLIYKMGIIAVPISWVAGNGSAHFLGIITKAYKALTGGQQGPRNLHMLTLNPYHNLMVWVVLNFF